MDLNTYINLIKVGIGMAHQMWNRMHNINHINETIFKAINIDLIINNHSLVNLLAINPTKPKDQ